MRPAERRSYSWRQFFYYNDTYRCLRERCTNDPNFFDQMEEKVRSKHREALGNDVFDLEFVDWMAEVGI